MFSESGGELLRRKREKRGLTQGGLALLIGYVDHVKIHRIEKGEHLPDDKLIEDMCKHLELAPQDSGQLKQHFENDRIQKSKERSRQRQKLDAAETRIPLSDVVEMPRTMRPFIRESRAKGDYHTATSLVDQMDGMLTRALQISSNDAARNALLTERAYILMEKVNILSDTRRTVEAWRGIRKILREQKTILEQVGSGETHALACFTAQGLCYMSEKHLMALKYAYDGVNPITDPYWQLAITRVTATNLTYLGRKAEALAEANKIQEMFNQDLIDDPYAILYGLNGIGRVYIGFRDEKGLDIFDQAWNQYEKIKEERGRSRLREIQLTIDHLKGVIKLDPSNRGLIEQLAQKALSVAEGSNGEQAYLRHIQTIHRLMKTL